MQETIKKVTEAESKAAEIVAAAGNRAAEIISKKNSEIAEKLNGFKAIELERFNKAVKDAELRMKEAVESVRTADNPEVINMDSIADDVLRRVMKTIFD